MTTIHVPDVPEPSPVLELDSLTRHFTTGGGTVRAVDGVTLTVARGEVLGLVGESGSGKSTVGRCAVRLDEPTSGTVRVNGTDITRLSRRALRPLRRAFHLVFQDPSSSLDPRMTVGRIVAEPLRLHGIARGERARTRAAALLAQVGLRPEHIDRRPHELSGGQRQRVSLARALAVDPDLLIADEPTSALDVSVQASVLNLLADLQRDRGFGCLFITHDLAAVEFLADRIAVMYLGEIVELAPAAALFAAPAHPYTQALLSAAPVPDPVVQRSRERIVLSGELPSPLAPPPGCRFHPRCPVAVDRCRTERPEPRTVPYPTARYGAEGAGPGGAGPEAGPGERPEGPGRAGAPVTRQVSCHLVADDGTAPDAAAGARAGAGPGTGGRTPRTGAPRTGVASPRGGG